MSRTTPDAGLEYHCIGLAGLVSRAIKQKLRVTRGQGAAFDVYEGEFMDQPDGGVPEG